MRRIRLFTTAGWLLALLITLGQIAQHPAVAEETQQAPAPRLFLPMIAGRSRFDAPPNPLQLRTTRDTSRAASATIPTSGGTLTTTAADGTRLTLTVPRDALLADTQITLTPISSVGGLPTSVRFVAGANLQPTGLRLYQPATLVTEPPAAKTIPVEREVSWASLDSGAQAHLHPLQVAPRVPTFSLFHFSSYYVGDGITIDLDNRLPTLSEAQIQHYIHQILSAEREAQQRGVEGDPQFAQKLEYLMREYFNVVIAPQLPAAIGDCGTAVGVIPQAISWMRQVQLVALGGRFTGEFAQLNDALVKMIDRCWNETIKPCLDKANPYQMARAISIARQAQLMGIDNYDPFTVPGCNCSNLVQVKQGWKVVVNFTWQDSANHNYGTFTKSYTGQRSASVTGLLNQANGANLWLGLLSGDARVNDTDTLTYRDHPEDNYQSTLTGNGAPEQTNQSGGQYWVRLKFDPASCTYTLDVPIYVAAQERDTAGNTTNLDERVADLEATGMPLRWTADTRDFTIRESHVLTDKAATPPARIYLGDVANGIATLNGFPTDVTVRWNIEPIATP
jgi:hypothetical protein